jgi:hypothetical protein
MMVVEWRLVEENEESASRPATAGYEIASLRASSIASDSVNRPS